MRIAISNLAWDVTEDAAVAAMLAERGIDAIDIVAAKYFPVPAQADSAKVEAVRRWWSGRGVEITGMQALLFGTSGLKLFGSDADRAAMLDHLTATCRIGASLGATRLVFGSPRNRDRGAFDEVRAQAVGIDFFRRLGDVAAHAGVSVCIEPAPPRTPHQKGRSRKKGKRLPTLLAVAADPHTVWERRVMPYWYGERRRPVEITSGTAVWFHGGLPPLPIRWVIVRDPKHEFKTQALLCTDLSVLPKQIVAWFVQRWQLEVTHREVREHLGVETQRQWSDQVIARTTPLLYGLFSFITVLAHQLAQKGKVLTRRTAWYPKPLPTFSDALAAVRLALWRQPSFQISKRNRDIANIPKAVFKHFAQALCST